MYLPLFLSLLNTNNKLLFRFKDTKLSTNIKSEYKRGKIKKNWEVNILMQKENNVLSRGGDYLTQRSDKHYYFGYMSVYYGKQNKPVNRIKQVEHLMES